MLNAKSAQLPHLRNLSLKYYFFDRADEDFRKWIGLATTDLAEVGVQFCCIDSFDDIIDIYNLRHLNKLFQNLEGLDKRAIR